MRVVDGAGGPLGQTTTDGSGQFALDLGTLPTSYELRVETGQGVLRALSEDPTDGFIEVNPLTTLVAEWRDRHAGMTLSKAVADVNDLLEIPQSNDPDTVLDSSPTSQFQPEAFMAQTGGLQQGVDQLLGRLQANPSYSTSFAADDQTTNLGITEPALQLLGQNLAGPGISNTDIPVALGVGPESLVGPIAGQFFGWALCELGGNLTLNVAEETLKAVGRLTQIAQQIQGQLANVTYLIVQGQFNQAVTALVPAETIIQAQAGELATLQAAPTYDQLQDSLGGFAARSAALNGALLDIFQLLTGPPPFQGGGVINTYRNLVYLKDSYNQALLGGLVFVNLRERGVQLQGLNTLLERLHLSFRPDQIEEGALLAERTAAQLRVAENLIVEQLEFTGTAIPRGNKSHAERGWLPRTLELTIAQRLQDYGLYTPAARTKLSSAVAAGAAQLIAVDSVDGFKEAALITIDIRENQEQVRASLVSGKLFVSRLARAHAAGARVEGLAGGPMDSPNIIVDRDASLLWCALPVRTDVPNDQAYARGDRVRERGLNETGIGWGWCNPTVPEAQHLIAHGRSLSETGDLFDGLRKMGFQLDAGFIQGAHILISGLDFRKPGDAEQPYYPLGISTFTGEYDFQHFISRGQAQLLVAEPDLALARLQIEQRGVGVVETLQLRPGQAVRLECRGLDSSGKNSVDLSRVAHWTVESGPTAYDPLTADQVAFNRGRLRVSNLSGSDGLLSVRALPTDVTSSPPEDYVIAAQVGSNTCRVNVRVGPGAPLAVAENYVSHVLVQDAYKASGSVRTVQLRAFGRFRPFFDRRPGLVQAPDVSRDISVEGPLQWSIAAEGTTPALLPFVRVAPNATTRVAELTIDRSRPLPAGGLVVVEARWTGTDLAPVDDSRPRVVRAKATVQVTN